MKKYSYTQAYPGFSTVEFFLSKPYLNPIIAWKHVVETRAPDQGGELEMTYPVTPVGVNDDPRVYILRPDGWVTTPYHDTYESLDDWLAKQMENSCKRAEPSGDEYL